MLCSWEDNSGRAWKKVLAAYDWFFTKSSAGSLLRNSAALSLMLMSSMRLPLLQIFLVLKKSVARLVYCVLSQSNLFYSCTSRVLLMCTVGRY